MEYGEFELPDGFELDAEALPAVKEVFNELGLNQDGAQRLISLFAENSSNLLEAVEQQAADEWQELRSDWTKVIETDPDIGGAKLPGVRASISKLFDRFGTPGLRDALKLTGADNNPEIVKTFAKMASVLSEGKYIAGSDPKPPPKTAAQALYPDGPNTGIMGQTS